MILRECSVTHGFFMSFFVCCFLRASSYCEMLQPALCVRMSFLSSLGFQMLFKFGIHGIIKAHLSVKLDSIIKQLFMNHQVQQPQWGFFILELIINAFGVCSNWQSCKYVCKRPRVKNSDFQWRLVVSQQSTSSQGHISFACVCDPFGRRRGTYVANTS